MAPYQSSEVSNGSKRLANWDARRDLLSHLPPELSAMMIEELHAHVLARPGGAPSPIDFAPHGLIEASHNGIYLALQQK